MTTVELLTRAADAAGEHADEMARTTSQWPRQYSKTTIQHLMRASGPDHWRAVEAMFRSILRLHRLSDVEGNYCVSEGASWPCPTLRAFHPLAEQVLQHLGDTP